MMTHCGCDEVKVQILEEIYQWMQHVNLVRSQYEFSEKWLGQSRSYYSAIRCTGRHAGMHALMGLRIRLSKRLGSLDANERQTLKVGSAFDVRPTLKQHISALDRLIEQQCED